MSWVLILIPAGERWSGKESIRAPAIIGGYGTKDEAMSAGNFLIHGIATADWNVIQKAYNDDGKKFADTSRWADFDVIPGAADQGPSTELPC